MSTDPSPEVLAVIPARFDSTRFPGKPLAPIAGRPMIQHVFEGVRQTPGITRTIVATDDERIVAAVREFGGEAILTRREHRCGTERVAEVAAHVPADIYLNVQGDEPLIEPAAIRTLLDAMLADDAVQLATLSTPIVHQPDIMDANVVKVVTTFDGDALYFSRAPIPWVRDASPDRAVQHMKHIGLYAFRREALLEYPALPPGDLERTEQLEQLRWMENGYAIRVAETEYDAVSVDLPGDIERVESILRARPKE